MPRNPTAKSGKTQLDNEQPIKPEQNLPGFLYALSLAINVEPV